MPLTDPHRHQGLQQAPPVNAATCKESMHWASPLATRRTLASANCTYQGIKLDTTYTTPEASRRIRTTRLRGYQPFSGEPVFNRVVGGCDRGRTRSVLTQVTGRRTNYLNMFEQPNKVLFDTTLRSSSPSGWKRSRRGRPWAEAAGRALFGFVLARKWSRYHCGTVDCPAGSGRELVPARHTPMQRPSKIQRRASGQHTRRCLSEWLNGLLLV